MADAFVSYKAEDRRRVAPLVKALEADGLSVWWDVHVSAGEDWRDMIQHHLDEAKCVVVVWSYKSVAPDGRFVRDEASRAQRRHVYLPICIDEVEPPLGFGETQAISLKQWNGRRSDPRYQSLLLAARALVAGEPKPQQRPAVGHAVDRRVVVVGGTAALAAATVAAWIALRPSAADASRRIAVLPFANLSGEPSQAYFSEGIAEEIRAALSRIGLQVIGRTSSNAVKDLDIKAAASKLEVANVLTGSVRRSPQTIRIDAQLVGGADGVERWAQSYDRAPGDVIKIQTDIAEQVARELSIRLDPAIRSVLVVGGTVNAAAHDLLLQAVQQNWDTLGGVERRLALLNAALSIDPNYAEAYARKAVLISIKAGTYERSAQAAAHGQVEALATVERAISIAPKMARGFVVRAFIYRQRLQMGVALANAKHALELPGNDPDVFNSYANIVSLVGRAQEALPLSAKAVALDPLNPGQHAVQAQIQYNARDYGSAVESARRSLQLGPGGESGRAYLGYALLAQGKAQEARLELGKLDAADFRRLVGEAVIAARAGRQENALQKLQAIEARYGDADHYACGQIYSQIGKIDEAFRQFDLAWKNREPGLANLWVDPLLDPVRNDHRFPKLEQRLV